MQFLFCVLALCALVRVGAQLPANERDMQQKINEIIELQKPLTVDVAMTKTALACIVGDASDYDECSEILPKYFDWLWKVYSHNWATKHAPKMIEQAILDGQKAASEVTVQQSTTPMMAVPHGVEHLDV